MIGIRKPGQGYWVRVLSAVFWAALVAAGAGFAWNQATLIQLETASFTYTTLSIDPTLEVNDIVNLVRPDAQEVDEIFGSAIVSEVGAGLIVITDFTDLLGATEDYAKNYAANATKLVEGTLALPESTAMLRPESGIAATAYPQEYLKAGAAGLVLLLGTFGLLWTHGSNRKITDFLIATDGEMRKVNWSSRKEIQGSTVVVIVATFLISAFLYAFDSLFSLIFTTLKVLQT